MDMILILILRKISYPYNGSNLDINNKNELY